jgi:hypothetical protein
MVQPELERRDAANSLWAFGWRGSIITICNNRYSEQTSALDWSTDTAASRCVTRGYLMDPRVQDDKGLLRT